ncbi:hypothetical protein [Thalassobacillus sp. CUG 92003]|uniref:hypothetical protein n=1 Tax=Thalassobacillus sp. CUG 92003 TaxID=2736641 RepID=UPI0015E76FCD|nr:hypothetical protein [Thalassobacillus sp. CUG 92003]
MASKVRKRAEELTGWQSALKATLEAAYHEAARRDAALRIRTFTDVHSRELSKEVIADLRETERRLQKGLSE